MKNTFALLFALLCLMNVQSFAQGVGISESSITPDASAILELRSATRGLLLPRLTTTNRDLISTLGMAVFNSTTNSLDVNNGSWISLASLASPTFTGTVTLPTPFTLGATSMTSTGTQLNYLNAATGTTGTASSNLVFSASPTFTGTVTVPTPFTLGATSVTSTGTQLNYLNAAAGTTGTASTNLVYSTSPTLTGVTLAAGSLTVDPLTFTSGTNLTTPASGAVEFDGTTFYQTTASGRGVAPSTQIAAIQTAFTLAAAAGVQSCLTATNDVLTVQGSTTYLIEGQYLLVTGATTHTTAMAFALGGGASVTSFEYTAMLWSSALNTISTVQSTTQVSGVASKVLNATSTAVTTTIRFFGVVRMNAGGTITPQIAFSANPTGTNQMKVGSYIKFTPIGTGTVTSVGNWN